MNMLKKIFDLRLEFSKSYLLGLLIAFEVPYPKIPWYIFGFAAFLISLDYKHKIPLQKLALMLSIAAMGLLSTVISPRTDIITPLRSMTTTFYFLLFMFGYFVDDIDAFLRGYVLLANFFSVKLLYYLWALGTYKLGIFILLPRNRDWGFNVFSDWPNYFAFILCIAFLVNALYLKRPIWAFINIAAALGTTSRGAIVAIAAYVIARCFASRKFLIGTVVFSVIIGSAVMIGLYKFQINTTLLNRLMASDDRAELYSFAWNLAKTRPIFGYGAILFDKSINFMGPDSFHNTYLDVLVRNGFPTLFLFLALIYPPKIFQARDRRCVYIAMVILFLLGSMVQNFLRHPHLFMFYSVWIAHADYFIPKATRQPEQSEVPELYPVGA